MQRACQKGKDDISVTKRAVGKNAGATFAEMKRNRVINPKHKTKKKGKAGKRAKNEKIHSGSMKKKE